MKLFGWYLLIALLIGTGANGQPGPARENVDWAHFLARSDMQWNKSLPNNWDNGVFLGNGTLGTIFWVNKNGAFNLRSPAAICMITGTIRLTGRCYTVLTGCPMGISS
jgi:hypothetical protein